MIIFKLKYLLHRFLSVSKHLIKKFIANYLYYSVFWKLAQGRRIAVDIELSDISTSVSSAACPGLVLGVSKVVKHIIVKPTTPDTGS